VGPTISDAVREAVFTERGRTVAFVGFYDQCPSSSTDTAHIAGMSTQLIVHRIAELARKYDFVAVSLHWGIENVFYPSPQQQSLARASIDAGATVLLGHHPHRFQGVEVYRGGVIFYSLGNFNFMQCGEEGPASSDLTAIADITIHDDGRVAYNLIPVHIGDDYCPRPMTDQGEIDDFMDHVENISRVLAEGVDKWWWFGKIGGPYLTGNLRAFGRRIRRYGFSHAIEMVRWLFGRFAIKCYVGLIRRWLQRRR
jgi:poly-gamma-glutamate synthesis protein (capsule biosynthesis protein)